MLGKELNKKEDVTKESTNSSESQEDVFDMVDMTGEEMVERFGDPFATPEDKKKRFIKNLLLCTLTAFMIAFNIKNFVRVGGLFPGGTSGMSLVILSALEKYAHIVLPYTAVYIPLNLIPIYIGIRNLGKNFTFFSIYVIFLSSFLTDLLPQLPIVEDVLLIAIFSGIINGVACSFALKAGAGTGGTDFISIFMSQKKGIDAWNYIFMGNVCMYIVAGFLFGFDKAMYSIIYQFCNTQMTQFLYRRYQKKTLLIITDKPEEVYNAIRMTSHHDATLFKGVGFFKGAERNLLYSVVSSEEKDKVLGAINAVDPKAFINVLKTELVDGRFFSRPRD